MGNSTRSGNSALAIEHVPIDSLRPDPANPRRISDAELEALTRSLREFGLVDPIIAQRDGTVIGGHQRLLAARRLGYKTVPAIYLDLPLEQAKLLGLALNRISGDWDQELLAQLLHGGWGCSEEDPVARYVVDALVLPIFEGVKPILELKIIARQLLGEHFATV